MNKFSKSMKATGEFTMKGLRPVGKATLLVTDIIEDATAKTVNVTVSGTVTSAKAVKHHNDNRKARKATRVAKRDARREAAQVIADAAKAEAEKVEADLKATEAEGTTETTEV